MNDLRVDKEKKRNPPLVRLLPALQVSMIRGPPLMPTSTSLAEEALPGKHRARKAGCHSDPLLRAHISQRAVLVYRRALEEQTHRMKMYLKRISEIS